MPVIGNPFTYSGAAGPAGGVLSGEYPAPDFAVPMATKADLSAAASAEHTHPASAVTSGTLAIARIPTSQSSTATAVPRADDPRLADPREWVRYDPSVAPVNGYAPVYNSATGKYAPGPVATDVPSATVNTRGIIRLAGDLGGNADAPIVVARGPFGGIKGGVYDPTFRTLHLDASRGNGFRLNVPAETITIDAPTNGADGQVIRIELTPEASTAFDIKVVADIQVFSGIALPVTVGSGGVGLVGLYYSGRTAKWYLVSANGSV